MCYLGKKYNVRNDVKLEHFQERVKNKIKTNFGSLQTIHTMSAV
jgi:hypothetical protein